MPSTANLTKISSDFKKKYHLLAVSELRYQRGCRCDIDVSKPQQSSVSTTRAQLSTLERLCGSMETTSMQSLAKRAAYPGDFYSVAATLADCSDPVVSTNSIKQLPSSATDDACSLSQNHTWNHVFTASQHKWGRRMIWPMATIRKPIAVTRNRFDAIPLRPHRHRIDAPTPGKQL